MGEQREQMLRGEWYLDDAELMEERRRCWRLLDRYNAARADDDDLRWGVLHELFGAVGDGTVVLPRLQCSYGRRVRLGRDVFLNTDTLLMDDAAITIGDGVRVGPRAQLLTALHPVADHGRRREGWERAAPVSIGAGAWLGAGVIVCPGVTIGEDAVIGAGSVVVRDVPARTLAVGNPARAVRTL